MLFRAVLFPLLGRRDGRLHPRLQLSHVRQRPFLHVACQRVNHVVHNQLEQGAFPNWMNAKTLRDARIVPQHCCTVLLTRAPARYLPPVRELNAPPDVGLWQPKKRRRRRLVCSTPPRAPFPELARATLHPKRAARECVLRFSTGAGSPWRGRPVWPTWLDLGQQRRRKRRRGGGSRGKTVASRAVAL